jgi:hypothetical protein
MISGEGMLGTIQGSASSAFSSIRSGKVESRFHWSPDTEDQVYFEPADFYHITWVSARRKGPEAEGQELEV